MKISILGTRGIPNNYGGFEQFADILSQGLASYGHDITVYCSENHIYKNNFYNGVKLIHMFDPENKIGTAGQFIYDLACINDARKRNFDIIYLLGYTSSSIWQRMLKGKAVVVTNMDGLEWKRSKYSPKVQKFLKYAEKLAVKYSDYLIADSVGIKSYLENAYNVDSTYYPYGSFVLENPSSNCLSNYNLSKYNYDVLIARFEPENNIEMVLEAFTKSTTNRKLILIGNYVNTVFGKQLFEKYHPDDRIKFFGAIYNQEVLNNLRYYSNLYFHGHSVGGTNPSLLEAMGSSSLICYHNNEFNSAIVGNDGFSFNSSYELTGLINNVRKEDFNNMLEKNLLKIKTVFSWDNIIHNYEGYFQNILSVHNS